MDDRSTRLDLTTAGRPARRTDDLRAPRPSGFGAPRLVTGGAHLDAGRPADHSRRVEDQSAAPEARTVDDHANGLSALADPVRRRILDLISELGPQSASMLAKHFDISRQAVLKHLVTLEDAGLVRRMPRGRSVLFVIDGEALVVTSQWLTQAVAGWALGRSSGNRPAAPAAAAGASSINGGHALTSLR